MSLPSKTSCTLLSRVRQGDPEGWQRLLAIYRPFVVGRVIRSGLSGADAEDVAQEVFAAVAKSIGLFRRDGANDSFLKWLQTITSSKLADFHRRRAKQFEAAGGSSAREQLNALPDPLANEDWSTDAEAKQSLLTRALDLMKTDFEERTWMAFWLTVIEQKDPQEICQLLKMTPGAVRQARSKVRRRLEDELRDFGDFGS